MHIASEQKKKKKENLLVYNFLHSDYLFFFAFEIETLSILDAKT